jgi:hypothetical protein
MIRLRSAYAPLFLAFACSIGIAPFGCDGETESPTATSAVGSSASSGAAGTGGVAAGSGSGATTGSGGSSGTTGSGGSGAGGSGGAGGGGDALSDMFDGPSLDASWTIFKPSVSAVSIEKSALVVEMTQAALWFEASQGQLVYKLVTGDFKVTSRVHARKTSSPADPPDGNVHLGGLMARDPIGVDKGGAENYVFIVVGRDENDLSVETKFTRNSMSDYIGPSWPSGDAELRLCRIGAQFNLYKRPIGSTTWELAIADTHGMLPSTLQVGAVAYTLGGPDLTVSFEEVVFAAVASQADCDKD